MVKNSIPDSTSACWNVLRCSSLEGFKQQLPLDKYTNRPYCIETIATAMFLLPPSVLQHRDPADIDAVFGALKRLGAVTKVTAAPQEELDAAMHVAMRATETQTDSSIPTDAHLPSLLRKQTD